MKKSTRANLMLILTALIWGVAFVAQDVAMDVVEPFTFNGARTLLAALVVLAFSLVNDRLAARRGTRDEADTGAGVPFFQMTAKQRVTLVWGGALCGVMLAASSSLQQVGLAKGSTAGKAGFITALYIVLVPLCSLLSGKRLRLLIVGAVGLSVAGLYLLCVKDGFAIEQSDAYLMLCAVGFTGHILVIDRFSRRTDCVKMSCIQFFVAGLICSALALIWEKPSLTALAGCIAPLLFAGVLSGGVGYTLQIVAQRDTDPTVASLLMCLESVFAVLAGWLILGDVMSAREYLGCFFMLCGIVLAQWPQKRAEATRVQAEAR